MLLEKLRLFASAAPDRLAVVAGADRSSYFELDRQADAVACHLSRQGVAAGGTVAVYTRRSASAIACLFGIMRAGAAYTVVEEDDQPAENLNRLRAIGADLILCDPERYAALAAAGLPVSSAATMTAVPAVDTSLPEVPAEATAYVCFTSGSTGKPKGVAVTHANIEHYVQALVARLEIPSEMRYAHVSTLAADLGNTSLFTSFWTGGTLHLLGAHLRKDPAALRDYLVEHDIQFLKITPSHYAAMLGALNASNADRLRLEYLLLGGEPLPVSLARRVLANGRVARLVNHYGPTETTVGVTVFPVLDAAQLDTLGENVPIGKPLGRTEIRVRTEQGDFVDTRASGELYIGGPSVARGYVGDPDGTDAKFLLLEGPDGERRRYYKTGDHVSVDAAGIVSFLGRVDRQIKVNGYRVELEHIESVLRTLSGVEDAAAFFLESRGRKRIVAAILRQAPSRRERRGMGLEQRLEPLLPGYMIPKVFLTFGEFPRNANGKTNLKELERLVSTRLEARARESQRPAAEPGSTLACELRAFWGQHLRAQTFDDEQSFFDLGGDSLDAIQLIGALQSRGYPVVAHTFLENPTLTGLLAAVARGKPMMADPLPVSTARQSRALSHAQRTFFAQALESPDHYNQAVLFDCGARVDVQALRAALACVVATHQGLRTAYQRERGGGVVATVCDVADVLGVSRIAQGTPRSEVARIIEETSQTVQESLRLEHGVLFGAHLFQLEPDNDQLLLVAHHLSVDVISWRILLGDLSRAYDDSLSGRAAEPRPIRTSFWSWVEHLETGREKVLAESGPWLARLPGTPTEAVHWHAENTEQSAQTLWLAFSTVNTRQLIAATCAKLGAPFHWVLLGSFVWCLARARDERALTVDVESHGRVTLDPRVDVSRVVGWHTSTFPVRIDVADLDCPSVIERLASSMRQLPHLGVAFGMHQGVDTAAAIPAAELCYNYLGEVDFDRNDRLMMRRSTYCPGRARGGNNNRGHGLKLSARILEGRLVLDLSMPGSGNPHELAGVLRELERVLALLASNQQQAADLIVEPGTRTGLLNYLPPALQDGAASGGKRKYQCVLLTGATGYVGSHVFTELLVRSDAHILCLVRSKPGRRAGERLEATHESYFPESTLARFRGRYTILEGDVGLERFGLTEELYTHLAARVDAVFHFAADTRLFGLEQEFRRSNVQSAESVVEFARLSRPKDLHYMSTLAVSGVNPRPEVVEFSEDSTDIGQEFQNHYEATKYEAERIIRSLEPWAGRSFIYRSGNITGHSKTACFQRNASDNRFIQFLAGCIKLGKLPVDLGAPIVLSPIDEVASGIVAIALEEDVSGGVFHVESSHETHLTQIFEALERNGIRFERSSHACFASLFNEIEPRDPQLALSRFWASRKPRNVRYNHQRTQRLLLKLGLSFTCLDHDWLVNFTSSLVKGGGFASRAQDSTQRASMGPETL